MIQFSELIIIYKGYIHPLSCFGGVAEPSENDNVITEKIKDALKILDIILQEHIIISDDGFYSYRQN